MCVQETSSSRRQSKVRHFIAMAKRILRLVLLVLEVLKQLLDLLK
jgi:hypothetical protein